jgi:uncharacterized protein YdeI (YjbR/CyaY-like superfamily)
MTESSGLVFGDRREWRGWLEDNHSQEREAWVVIQKKRSTRKGLEYEEAVEEAICFGWIDSKMQSIDAKRFRQRFSPRKINSIWSKINRERAERLMERGMMAEAGYEAIEEAKGNGMWDSAYTSKEEPTTPRDLLEALKEDRVGCENWGKFSNSVKLMYVRWVESAKREETRARRIDEVVRRASENIKPS